MIAKTVSAAGTIFIVVRLFLDASPVVNGRGGIYVNVPVRTIERRELVLDPF